MLWFNFHLGSFFFSNQFVFFKPVIFFFQTSCIFWGSTQPFHLRVNVFGPEVLAVVDKILVITIRHSLS